MRLKLTVLSFIAAGIFGCKSNPSNPQAPQTSVIMPLAIGNSWIYETTSYYPTGYASGITIDTTVIQNTAPIGGETFDFIRNYEPPNLFSSTGYSNRADGLWLYYSGEAMMPYTILYVPYPAEPNIPYTQTSPFDYSVTLLNADTAISVPKGNFHVLKYQRDYLDGVSGNPVFFDMLYYAVNIGLIYSESYSLDSTGKLILISKTALRQYFLN
jgi:hypothetical protein